MKSFNFDSIEASSDDFQRLPAGPYVVRITEATDNEAKQYVEVVYDIAEGEHAGYYGDDWGKKHPYAHHVFLSYKDTALGMLKGRLEAITASNPGFDAMAAWNAGRTDMFVGRVVGVNLQEEEYEWQGEVRTRLNVCQVVDAQRVRDGKVKARDKKTLDRPAGGVGGGAVASYDASVDIPFD